MVKTVIVNNSLEILAMHALLLAEIYCKRVANTSHNLSHLGPVFFLSRIISKVIVVEPLVSEGFGSVCFAGPIKSGNLLFKKFSSIIIT